MITALRARVAALRLSSRRGAWVLLALGLAGVCDERLALNAFALEAVAAGFWLWARDAENAETQVRRWAWLRRPATMLWLAFALASVSGWGAGLARGGPTGAAALYRAVRWAAGAAALWAALELLGALPFARPYPDWPGPLSEVGAWLPLSLTACGVALMARGARLWLPLPPLPAVATALLLFGSLVASLRAFGRPQWPATLRWLAVSDSALAGVLITVARTPLLATLLLWASAFSARAVLLWSELHGASVRRAPASRALWRLLSWMAGGALAWAAALTMALASGPLSTAGLVVTLAIGGMNAWLSVARLSPATERRSLARAGAEALRTAVLGLALVWWTSSGAVRSWRGGLEAVGAWVALLAGVVFASAGVAAHLGTHLEPGSAQRFDRLSRSARGAARSGYQALVRFEHGAFGVAVRLWRGLLVPLRDLHTGDAQEYLLLLLALAAAALLLPLLG